MLIAMEESAAALAVCPGCGSAARTSDDFARKDWRWTSGALWRVQLVLVLLALVVAAVFAAVHRGPMCGGLPAVIFFLLLGQFLGICVCGSAPDRAASRAAVACTLTIAGGTVATLVLGYLVLGVILFGGPNAHLIGFAYFFGVVSTGFAAFVFLMRFHASVAKRFGNRRLRRECHIFIAAPIFAVAVNWAFEYLRFVQPPVRELFTTLALAQACFNLGVLGWYATIVFRTFRTIDRGPALDDSEPLTPPEEFD